MREAVGEARIVFSEELRRYIRRPIWLIVTGLVPAILLILLIVVPIIRSIADDDDDDPKPIGYLDLSGELSEADFPNLTRFDTRQDGIDAIVAGEVEDLFIVPADFLESGDVEWLSQRSGIFAGGGNRDRFATFLTVSLIADRLDPSLLDRAISGADYVRAHVAEDGSVSPDDDNELSQFVVPFIFTFLLMMSIFMGAGTLRQSVSEEKENRMIDVLLTSVSPLALMAGKILALGTTSLVQMIVWIASIAIIGPQIVDQIPNAADLDIEPLTLVYVSLFFIAGYFLFSTILAGIGSATTSEKEAGPISAIVIVPAAIPLWLSSVILSAPDGGLARVLSFIPNTAATTMMQRIGSVDVSNAEILASLGVLALAGVVMLFVSARIFRAGLLLYGQRMTLGAVWRAARSAGLARLSGPDEALRTRARQAFDQTPCLQVELDGHGVPGHGCAFEQRGRDTPFDLSGQVREGQTRLEGGNGVQDRGTDCAVLGPRYPGPLAIRIGVERFDSVVALAGHGAHLNAQLLRVKV